MPDTGTTTELLIAGPGLCTVNVADVVVAGCQALAVRDFPTFYLISGDGQVEGAGNAVHLLARALQPR